MAEFDALEYGEVKAWREACHFDPDIVTAVARFPGFNGLMLACQLVWPQLIVKHGCVLLPFETTHGAFDEMWEYLEGDRFAVENIYNRLELGDIPFRDKTIDEGLDSLGILLTKTWTLVLKEQFPEREFRVHFTNDEYDNGPTVWIESVK